MTGDELIGTWKPRAEKWRVETPHWSPNCVIITIDSAYSVTIDMSKRLACLGISTPNHFNTLTQPEDFTGRGWRARLIDTAVDHLIACVGDQIIAED